LIIPSTLLGELDNELKIKCVGRTPDGT